MAKRKIIKIDEKKCDGCGLCIPNCPEGALKVIDGKARLISDLFCDGLGACIGHCPKGAIIIEEREAEPYNERKVMANIVKAGPNVIKEHLKHLKDHKEMKYLKEAMEYLKEKKIRIDMEELDRAGSSHAGYSCPGSRVIDFKKDDKCGPDTEGAPKLRSQLGQWPVQIMLISPQAPYFKDADLLIAADCVPFAYANFHNDLLRGKVVLVGCPKLDDLEIYKEKLGAIIKDNDIRSVTYVHMEVPCCFGLVGVLEDSIASSGKKIPFKEIVISIRGERIK